MGSIQKTWDKNITFILNAAQLLPLNRFLSFLCHETLITKFANLTHILLIKGPGGKYSLGFL